LGTDHVERKDAAMGLGRRVSREVAERCAADRDLAGGLRDRLTAAEEAERRLRDAQARGLATGELAVAYDRALVEAILAAEAAERAAMGPKTYEHGDPERRRAAQIAARKARAKPSVRSFTAEVDRLRTLREEHKLTYRTAPERATPGSIIES
jgi:hypothetical protein